MSMYSPYIKDKNTKNKILYSILISLIPFIIYKIYLTNIQSFISLLMIVITSFLTTIIFDLIKNYKNFKFNFKNYIYSIIIGVITYIFIPHNTPLLLVSISTIIGILINKLFKNVNPILITSFISYIYFIITKNSIIELDINIYILTILSIISFGYLIYNKAIKFRITLLFLIISLLGLFIKPFDINNLYSILILSIYVIPEFYSTPNTALGSIIYTLILGILSVFIPLEYFIIVILILNIINKYIDLNSAYYLVSKS